MSLSDHVQLTLILDSVGIARAGFGVPMVLSHTATFPERIRYYNSLADVAADFAAGTPEYLAANAFFAQSPKPVRIGIGRATTAVTQVYQLSANVVNSQAYKLDVAGMGFDDAALSYTSDVSATAAEIHNGLVTALNAVVDKNYLAAFAALVFADQTFTVDAGTDVATLSGAAPNTGAGPFQLTSSDTLPAGLALATDYWFIKTGASTGKFATSLANALAGTAVDITDAGTGVHTMSDTVATKDPSQPFKVTGDAANEWFSLAAASAAYLNVAQTHTVLDANLAADLDAILLEDSGWYELHTLYNSVDYILAAADWVEANKRIYVFDTNDSASITTAYSEGVSEDTLAQVFDEGYSRTMGAYHPDPSAMFAAAWMGRWLPTEPGAATTKGKTLNGISPVIVTGTYRNNLIARRANTYQRIAGRNITWEGTVPSTTYRFLDVVRDLDWVEDDMTKGVFGAIVGTDKVPYTSEGILLVENEVRASVTRAVNKGIFADDPAPVVTAPDIADVAPVDKEERILRDVQWTATLAGAIHKVLITGVVTF